MKVYVAAAYPRRDDPDIRSFLAGLDAAEGIEIVSTWFGETGDPLVKTADLASSERVEMARRCLRELDVSTDAVFFGQRHWDPRVLLRGGRHAEFGYALAGRVRLWLVGEDEHVFHSLVPGERRFATGDECMAAMIDAADGGVTPDGAPPIYRLYRGADSDREDPWRPGLVHFWRDKLETSVMFKCPCGKQVVYVENPPHAFDFDDDDRLSVVGSVGYREGYSKRGEFRRKNWCHFSVVDGEAIFHPDAICPGSDKTTGT